MQTLQSINEVTGIWPSSGTTLSLAEEADCSNLYALLATFFLTGLDEEWLLAVQELEFVGATGGRKQYLRHVEAIKALIAAEPEEKIILWQTEYTRLFLGPGKAPAYPYESVYRSPGRLIMQEITAEVRRVYLEQGLVMGKLYTQPEDHLGVELEFLGYLQRKRQEEPKKGEAMAEVQREFIYTHLLTWMDDFTQDVISSTEEPLFQEIARLLQEFLQNEERRLSIMSR